MPQNSSSMQTTNLVNSDYATAIEDVTIATKTVDTESGNDETRWTNPRWTQQWGYFNSVPDLKAALVLKAIWNVGGGYQASPAVQAQCENVTGNGMQTFDDIIFNMDITSSIGGDAYAEIMIDEETGDLINLKEINPSSMVEIYNKKGILIGYEQIRPNGTVQKFKPNEIFHIRNLGMAGQIHGISDIDPLEQTILADQESFKDTKRVMHHQAVPLIIWKLKTDDPTKIAQIVAKIENARNLGEDTFIPDDDEMISHEVVQVSPSALIMQWRGDMRNRFFRGIGLPEILPSGAEGSSESSGKIGYLAFERVVQWKQKYYERQIKAQLGLDVELIPPVSLESNMIADQQKDGPNNFKPSDTVAGTGA